MASLIRPIVLVVDDDPAVLGALEGLLAARLEPPYRVETARSAEEALELVARSAAERTPIAAVISDEKMPGRTGTDLLIALRQSPAHRHGGRIIITAYAGLASAKRAINEAEVVRYFPKPWDADGALLPALGEILEDFAARCEADRFLLATAVEFDHARQAILEVRRAWWEYTSLMGLTAAEAEAHEPDFIVPADSSAAHFVVRRRSPRENTSVAAIRLEPAKGAAPPALGALTFRPEEASAEVEVLLLRTALLHAWSTGANRVRVEAPEPRLALYQGLGFEAVAPAPAGAAVVAMEINRARSAGVEGAGRPFALRFGAEQRLCACAQTTCPAHDYAAARRGYFCPLDLLERRVPVGFPSGRRP